MLQIEYARSKKPGLNPNLPAGDILSINVVLERQEEEEEEAAEEEAAVERFRAGVTNETYAFKLSYAPDDRVITAEVMILRSRDLGVFFFVYSARNLGMTSQSSVPKENKKQICADFK